MDKDKDTAEKAATEKAAAAHPAGRPDGEPVDRNRKDGEVVGHGPAVKAGKAKGEGPAAGPATSDNTAREAPPKLPTLREIEEKRKARFGDKPGAVRLDVDAATGEGHLVYVDADGNEVQEKAKGHAESKTRAEDKPA